MEFGATYRFKRILIIGPPGIGKTTVCKRVIQLIKNTNYTYDGFYTEEVRSSDRKRIGFDVVPVNDTETKGCLARIESALGGKKSSNILVGNYHVLVNEFERVALSHINTQTDVLIIDEIGKMELFSESFQECVEKLFLNNAERKPLCILATIPEKNRIPRRHAKFFEKLHQKGDCKIMNINMKNRNELPEIVFRLIANIVACD